MVGSYQFYCYRVERLDQSGSDDEIRQRQVGRVQRPGNLEGASQELASAALDLDAVFALLLSFDEECNPSRFAGQ